MKSKRITWLLIIPIGISVFLVACNPSQSTETAPIPTGTSTSMPPTNTLTPTDSRKLTITPIPISFVNLGSPFSSECSPALIVCDNSFNGIQERVSYNQFSGHVDIWTNTCNFFETSGEVLAPASGTISQIRIDVFGIALDSNTYVSGITEALKFMGIKNPVIKKISWFNIELGHISLRDGVKPGQHVEKGMSFAEIISCNCGLDRKLAYQIRFKYDGDIYQISPTLLRHDNMVEPNFQLPDSAEYSLVFPDGLVPFQCDITKVPNILGKDFWQPYFCFPEPNAQH
jgi:hypothetical protein